MARRLVLLLLFAAVISAQTISGLKICDDDDGNPDLGPNGVCFEFAVSGLSGSTTFSYSTGTTTGLGNTIASQPFSSDGTYHRSFVHGTASTTQYYQIDIGGVADTDCPVTCTDCTSSDDSLFAADSNGINCTTGEPFRVTHTASGTRTPTAPTHADTDIYNDCAADGTPTQSTCSSLASDLATLAGTAGVHQVDLETGVCQISSTLTLPTLTTASRICIRSDLSDADLRPTDTSQIAQGMIGQMAVIEHTNPYDRQEVTGTPPPVLKIPDNYTLTDIAVRDIQIPQNPVQATVTGYSGTTTVTLTLSDTCPAEFDIGAVVVLDMPGLDAYQSATAISSCSGTSLAVSSSVSFSGTLSGNGTATLGSVPISGAADNGSGAVRLTTAAAHGLPTGNYSGSDTVYVHNVSGTTEANGRWLFTVIDSTHIDLTGSTFSNIYSASSYDFLRLNSTLAFDYINAQSTTGVHLGRLIVGNPSPQYAPAITGVNFYGAEQWVLRDSIVFGPDIFCPISVTDNLPDCLNYLTRTGTYVRGDGTQDGQIINNLFTGAGGIVINFQNQQDPNRDVTIKGNHVITTDRPCPDVQGDGFFPNSLQHYQENRHNFAELKSSAYRFLIQHNYIKGGCVTLEGRLGYSILVSNSSGGGSGVYRGQDVDIVDNWFEDILSPLAIGAQENAGTRNMSFFNRIRFEGNFIYGDATNKQQSPQSFNSASTAPDQSGQLFSVRSGGQYITVNTNTWWRMSGHFAGSIQYQGDKMPGCQVNDNLFGAYHRNPAADEGLVRFDPSFSDYDETSNLTEWDKLCPDGSFTGNVMVAGVEDGRDVVGCQDDSSDACNVTSAEIATLWPTSGSFADLNLGPTDSTYTARLATVFGSDRIPDDAYSGIGADMAALRANVFKEILGLEVTYCSAHPVDCPTGSLTFDFTSWTTSACSVRLTDDAWTSAVTATDAGGDTTQTVSFTGISSGAYEAWVECPEGKPFYWKKSF